MCCLFVIADHALIDTVHDLDPMGFVHSPSPMRRVKFI